MMTRFRYELLFIFALFLFYSGCAGPMMRMPRIGQIKGVPQSFHRGDILDLHQGKAVSFDAFIERVSMNDLIFIGEVHTNPEHHLIQAQILERLLEKDASAAIAMEFFKKSQQPVIDAYLAGKISEDRFLEKIDWKKTWGFPYHFYRPLMRLARTHKLRVLGIDAPRKVIKKIARYGLKGLTPEERGQLPKTIHLDDPRHRAFVRKAYAMHRHDTLRLFDYFYEAQCAREDAMAANLASYFKKNMRHRGKLIVFSGNGHIIERFGIPNRTIGRIPVDMATVMPLPLDPDEPITKIRTEIADYVWLTSP